MSWDVGLAGMFKERDVKSNIGPCVGKVVGVNPLKISILNGEITLQEEQLYILESLFRLNLNEQVLLIPTADEQSFFIIDVVKKAGG